MELDKLVLPLEVANDKWNLGIGTAIAGVTALLAAMGAAINATFKWADELDQLQDVMGLTNEQAAALAYTARVSGVSVETLAKANTILAKGLVNSKGQLDTTGKALKNWGIDVLDANGKLKDQTALIGEVAKKYGELGTQTEKVNFLTEVYGRNGAELVDFFDTLAKQGGIDAVSEKVKNLGLAIDPNRYEQFNRDLEELKLIGLSLAVAFTERVMPMLEGFIAWIGDVAGNPVFQQWAQTIGGFVASIPSMLEQAQGALQNFDSAQFAQDAMDFGANIDWTIVSANLISGIESIDWNSVGAVIGEKVDQILDVVGGLAIGLYNAISGAIQQLDWGELFYTILAATLSFIEGLSGTSQGALLAMFTSWILTARTALTEFLANVFVAMANLQIFIVSKLYQIDEFFTDIVGGWIVNAWGVLKLKIGGFLSYLTNIVDQINAIIAKINPFDINLPDFGTGGGGSGGGGSSGSGGGGSNGNRGRASGGPVVAGQDYNVVELNKPEIFTPNTGGRIDPKTNQGVTFEFDYRTFAAFLATELAKAI